MPAYIVARVEAHDPSLLKSYQTAVPPIITQYGGRFIARGGSTVTLEGPVESRRIVIIEFEAFYHLPEYSAARKLREGIAVMAFIAVDGIS